MNDSRWYAVERLDIPVVDVPALMQQLKEAEAEARGEFQVWDHAVASTGDSSNVPSKRKASAASLDSDDDSDEDYDTDTIAPYDPSTQTPPSLPIYYGGFLFPHELAGHVLHTLKQFLRTAVCGGYQDKEVEQLLEQLVKTTKPPMEPMIRIAITGDTGSGKSATLNSILGVNGLTPEGDGGGAVTNVVTEFRKLPNNSKSPLLAEVQFFCLE